MPTISEVNGDISNQEICLQECTPNVENSSRSRFRFRSRLTDSVLETISNYGSFSGTANFLYNAMTAFKPNPAYISITGETKWQNNGQQIIQRYNYTTQQMHLILPPPIFYNAYRGAGVYPGPRGQFIPPYYNSFYYNPVQPRIFFTSYYLHGYCFQPNYQPFRYQYGPAQPTLTYPIYGPPRRDLQYVELLNRHRTSANNQQYSVSPHDLERPALSHDVKCPQSLYEQERLALSNRINKSCKENTRQPLLCKNDMTVFSSNNNNYSNCDTISDLSRNFEFTIQPEQFVSSLCDEKEEIESETQLNAMKNTDNVINELPSCETMDLPANADDDLTKFVIEGCLQAEAIAARNRHRPCFRNIKYLCNRARIGVLRPKTTSADIHSQGRAWATKDFIYVYLRLLNSWYVLKGYLDDVGSLGDIDAALSPEFKHCYQQWQNINKEMVKHLVDTFKKLDMEIRQTNAEMLSCFNNTNTSNNTTPSSFSVPCENHNTYISEEDVQNMEQKESFSKNEGNYTEVKKFDVNDSLCNIDKIDENLQSCWDNKVNVPSILRGKQLNSNIVTSQSLNNKVNKEDECKDNNIYMESGSYFVSKKISNLLSHSTNNDSKNETFGDAQDLQENCNIFSSTLGRKVDTLVTDSQSANSPFAYDFRNSDMAIFGPLTKTILKDSEDICDLENKESYNYDKYLLNDSSEKYCEVLNNAETNKTVESIKDNTQLCVNDHYFENYMDNDMEKILDAKSTKIDKQTININLNKNSKYSKTKDDCDSSTVVKNETGDFNDQEKNQSKNYMDNNTKEILDVMSAEIDKKSTNINLIKNSNSCKKKDDSHLSEVVRNENSDFNNYEKNQLKNYMDNDTKEILVDAKLTKINKKIKNGKHRKKKTDSDFSKVKNETGDFNDQEKNQSKNYMDNNTKEILDVMSAEIDKKSTNINLIKNSNSRKKKDDSHLSEVVRNENSDFNNYEKNQLKNYMDNDTKEILVDAKLTKINKKIKNGKHRKKKTDSDFSKVKNETGDFNDQEKNQSKNYMDNNTKEILDVMSAEIDKKSTNINLIKNSNSRKKKDDSHLSEVVRNENSDFNNYEKNQLKNYMDNDTKEILVDAKLTKINKKIKNGKHRKKKTDSDFSKVKNKTGDFNNQEKNQSKKTDSNQTFPNMCSLFRPGIGLSLTVVDKFERIIDVLRNLQFSNYITDEANAENVPDYCKYVSKPMFLCKILKNLKQNKYTHIYQVVHDLRTIVRNSELYLKKCPNCWFKNCLLEFSRELETQLAKNFASIDFSSVTGDPLHPPETEYTLF